MVLWVESTEEDPIDPLVSRQSMKSVGIVAAWDSGTNREMWTSSVPCTRFAVIWMGGGLSLVSSADSVSGPEEDELEEVCPEEISALRT